jgi:predicted acetyltransferase
MTFQLVPPSIKYKESFLEAQEEMNQCSPKFTTRESRFITEDSFKEYVQKLLDNQRGKNLPKGYVPATTYWLVKNEEWLGEINIRHKITPWGHIGYVIRPSVRGKGIGTKMLQLALLKARQITLKKILITCDNKNNASIKIIEKNGGVLENIVEDIEIHQEIFSSGKTRRYWITLK